MHVTFSPQGLENRSTDNGNNGLTGGEIAGLVVGILGLLLTALTVFKGLECLKARRVSNATLWFLFGQLTTSLLVAYNGNTYHLCILDSSNRISDTDRFPLAHYHSHTYRLPFLHNVPRARCPRFYCTRVYPGAREPRTTS